MPVLSTLRLALRFLFSTKNMKDPKFTSILHPLISSTTTTAVFLLLVRILDQYYPSPKDVFFRPLTIVDGYFPSPTLAPHPRTPRLHCNHDPRTLLTKRKQNPLRDDLGMQSNTPLSRLWHLQVHPITTNKRNNSLLVSASMMSVSVD